MSTVHVTMRDTGVAALQASLTFHVRVCDRLQPVEVTVLSTNVGVPTEQLSVAVAEPRASSIAVALGLQPRDRVVPVAMITGGSMSTVHVTMRDTGVAALQASLTF